MLVLLKKGKIDKKYRKIKKYTYPRKEKQKTSDSEKFRKKTND